MEKNEIWPIAHRNPVFALDLLCMKPEILEKAVLYKPEDEKGLKEYDQFCKKLNIRKKPYLLILEDDHLNRLAKDDGTQGFYMPIRNVLCLSRSTYKDLMSSKPFAKYILAHEIGHSKDIPRREVLKLVAAWAGGVTTAGTTAYLIDVFPDEGETMTAERAVKLACSISAGIAASFTIEETMSRANQRAAEFAADDHAATVIGKEGVIEGIAEIAIKQLKEKMSDEQFAKLAEEYQASIKNEEPLSPEQDQVAFAIYLSSRTNRLLSLSDYFKNQQYPIIFERIKHQNGELSR